MSDVVRRDENAVASRGAAVAAAAITGDDLAIERLTIKNPGTRAANLENAPLGSITASLSSSDPAAKQIYDGPGTGEGVLFHPVIVARGLDGEDPATGLYKMWIDGDPAAPLDAKRLYKAVGLAPEYSLTRPVEFMIRGSATWDTGKIFMTLVRETLPNPPWHLSIRITTIKQENDRGRWWAPVVEQVEAKPAHVQAAAALALLLLPPDDEPEAAPPAAIEASAEDQVIIPAEYDPGPEFDEAQRSDSG
jgi:hypothetical protein